MAETFETSPKAIAVLSRFREEFGGGDARLFFAPGRANLIGNHVDYNGGTVLPIAVDQGVFVAARLNEDGTIRLRSLDCEPPVDLDLTAIGAVCDKSHAWASYPLGVCKFFSEATGRICGVEMVFGGDLPIASGLSSSAAVEIATAFALDALHGTALPLAELARIGFRAETLYIGLKCGIMDQFASALGLLDQVLILDCGGETFDYAPIDSEAVEFLILDTGVPRSLSESHYNQRVGECAEAHRVLSRIQKRRWLADYTAADLAAVGPKLVGVAHRRATHVVTEMERVNAAVTALRAQDLPELGRLLNASHASSSELYEVSCPELDLITAAARECDGVFGARLTGAGFGGCAVALLQPGTADAVQAHVTARFEGRFGIRPSFYLLSSGPGPGELHLD